jgi:hypothetical protein
MFATMNLLAFAFHTVCDSLEQLWIQGRTAKGSRLRFFHDVRTLTATNWEVTLFLTFAVVF